VSAGTDAGERAVLWYAPGAAAVGQVPADPYPVSWVWAGYQGYGDDADDFLNHLLAEVRRRYGVLGDDFGARFGDLTGTTWYLSAGTWPSDPANGAWIAFWRELDVELAGRLGAVGLGDDFWAAFPQGPLDHLYVSGGSGSAVVPRVGSDQLGNARADGEASAVGAVEAGAPPGFWTRAEAGGGR
jgi:hypothetical protein